MRIYFLFIFFISYQIFAQNSAQIEINKFTSNPLFQNASISFFAIDVKTGDTIAMHNPNLSLPPASTTKLFSTATALEVLGSNYKPQTRLYAEGKIENDSILNGNLWVRGGGDPTLGSTYFLKNGSDKTFLKEWVDTLKKMGVKSINGDIIGDASEFGYNGIPDGWNWSDMGNYYGAGPSGLNIYDNILKFYFRTNSILGSKAQLLYMYPQVQDLKFHNYIEGSSVNGDNSYIYGAPYSLDRFGTGALPINSNNFLVKGSIPDPEFQFANEVYNYFKLNGISINGTFNSVRKMQTSPIELRYGNNYKLLYTHQGESIFNIAKYTNMQSINLFAEALLCLSAYKVNENGTYTNALTQMEKYWKNKIDFTGLYIKDGSGLSRSNAISAKHFCSLLKEMYKSPNYKDFYNTLPIAGISGTLSSVCKNQPGQGKIHAKSGTINRIKSYAGYIETKSGKTVAFAFIVNNYNCSANTVVNLMENVFNAIVLM